MDRLKTWAHENPMVVVAVLVIVGILLLSKGGQQSQIVNIDQSRRGYDGGSEYDPGEATAVVPADLAAPLGR